MASHRENCIELNRIEASPPTEENLKRLFELSYDPDDLTRCRAVELMDRYDTITPEMLARVREGLSDKYDMLRTECVELLEAWEDHESIGALRDLMDNDDSWIVRAAAINALGELGGRDIATLLFERYSTLTTGSERLSCAVALYRFTKDKSYLHSALSFLSAPDSEYHLRCKVANILSFYDERLDESDKAYALKKFKATLAKEKSRAVASYLSAAIKQLESS